MRANPALLVPDATVVTRRLGDGTNHMLLLLLGRRLACCAVAGKQLDGRRELWQNCRSLGKSESRCVGKEMEGGRRKCFAKPPTR